MKRYVIHLKTEENGKNISKENARKNFYLTINSFLKDKEIVQVKEEYTGQVFDTAVFVDILEEKLDKIIDGLRELEIIDIIEPWYPPTPETKIATKSKTKDLNRFLK